MESVRHRFRDLSTAVDDARSAIDASMSLFSSNGLVADSVEIAKIVAHEWIANLVRHGSFARRTPDIVLDVWAEGAQIVCVIEDNSDGFDLESELDKSRRGLGHAPERGMGLVMVSEFTEELKYEQLASAHNRVRWSISADANPYLDLV